MPLHEWSETHDWEGMHSVWIVALLHDIKPRLPEGYRAYLSSGSGVAFGSPFVHPDLSMRHVVGEPTAEGGRYLAVWRRKLTVGQALPVLPLPLTPLESVILNLETTYMQAAADVFLT